MTVMHPVVARDRLVRRQANFQRVLQPSQCRVFRAEVAELQANVNAVRLGSECGFESHGLAPSSQVTWPHESVLSTCDSQAPLPLRGATLKVEPRHPEQTLVHRQSIAETG